MALFIHAGRSSGSKKSVDKNGAVWRSRLRAAFLSATAALGIATASRSPAAAQCTQVCSEMAAILTPFQQLLSTPQGQVYLSANANKIANIYQSATANSRSLAITNSEDIDVASRIATNIWAMTGAGLSITNAMAGQTPALNLLQPVLSQIFHYYTDYLKYYFASYNIYGQAYNNLGTTEDPRPFIAIPQVAQNPWNTNPSSPYYADASDVIAQAQERGPNGDFSSPSFPSGHTLNGYTTALIYAVLVPEYYQSLVQSAQEFGLSRNIIGAHYPTDVIGSRIAATYNLVQVLASSPQDFQNAAQEIQTSLGNQLQVPYAQCASDVAGCIAAGAFPTAAQFTANNQAYVSSITYDLPPVGPTDGLAILPTNSYLLLTSRFPYLTVDQINAIILSTELPSGVPLDDFQTGWARLNLYAAASGYGHFTSDVSVTLNASLGGFNAIDMWSNNISGAGGLTLNGTGTLILGGNNTYTGGTTVAGGTLALTGTLIGDLTILSGGTFVTAGGYQVNPGSTLTNQGLFQSVNAYLLNAGQFTNYAEVQSAVTNLRTMRNTTGAIIHGAVNNSGVFINNGTLDGGVTNDGVLNGTGLIIGNVVNNGILAPGNSIGTLSVTGAVSMTPGSIYQAEIGATGVSDMLTVHGPIALGGTLQLVQTTVGVPLASSYSLLSATAGISGAFSEVQVYDSSGDLYPFLGADFSTIGGTLMATVAANMSAFAAAGDTANEQAVGQALSTLSPSSNLIGAALGLTAPNVVAAFNALSGEAYPSTSSMIQQQSVYVREAVGARLRQSVTAPGVQPLGYAAKAAGPATAELAPGLTPTLWAQGYGGWGETFSNGNAASISNSIGGFLIGADVAVLPNARAGLFGGFSQSQFNVDARSSSGSMDNYDIGLYGAAQFGGLALRAGLSYTWHDISMDRTVAFTGLSQALSAGYSVGTTQVFGELGYDVAVGTYAFEPFVGLAYVATNGASFTETGGSAGLTGDIAAFDTFYTTLGVRAATSIQVMGATLIPNVTVGWQHAFGDTGPTANMLFQGGATPFQISGAPIAEDALMLGAGLSYRLSDVASLSVSYTGQLAATASQNAFTAQFALKF